MKNILKIVLAMAALGMAGTASATVIHSNNGHSHHAKYQGRNWHANYRVCGNHLCNRFIRVHSANRPETIAVPEPTTLALLGAGLLGLSLSARRRKAS